MLLSGEFADHGMFVLPFFFALFLIQVMLRYGYVKSTGGFLITFVWSALSVQAYNAHGLYDVAVLAYPIITLLAALLLGWQVGLFSGILSITMIWFFAFQKNQGWRFNWVDEPLSYARDVTAVFIVSSVLTYMLIHRLNRSLSDSRLELRERLRADEKLQQQARYLSALHETALGLVNRLELKPLLELILTRASELLNTPHVGIDLVTPDEEALHQELGRGIYAQWNGAHTPKGMGLTGKVWEQGQTILIQDYDNFPTPNPNVLNSELGAVIGTPLRSQDKIIGTLLIAHTDKQKKFTQDQVILLEQFAALASIAIDNARLYENAQTEIIERKIIEQELRSSEERFRKVFENNKIAISIVTLDRGVFLEANEAFWNLSGLSPEKALGRSVLDFEFWANPADREQFVQTLLEKGALQNVEVEFTDDTGNIRTTLAYYEIINIREQQCILSMFYDITEQKHAQIALQNAERRTHAIIDSIPDLIFEVSKTGTFLDFLASTELVPIMEPQKFVGKNMRDLFPQKIAEQALFAIEHALSSEHVQTLEYGLPPEEEIQFFEARVTPVTAETVIIMVRDISQRKWVDTEREKLIQELEARNAESETLRESMSIIVETLDEHRTVSLILEQLEKVIPYDSASVQLLRDDVLEIVSIRGLNPANHIGLQFKVNFDEPSFSLLTGKAAYVLFDNVQRDVPTFIYNSKDKNIHAWLATPLRVKGNIIGIIALDGHSVGQFSQKDAELAVTYANQVTIALENARLFSEAQDELFERMKLIQELEIKNAELERFTYTVSHDLKSPIITIRGFLGFLEQDALNGNQARLRSDIKRISDATEKMQSLLNDLLELSRVGRLVNPPMSIPFNDLVQESLDIVQGQIQKSMAQVSVQKDLPSVFVDRPRMVEALQNLIDNAVKFIGKNPRIEIGQDGTKDDMPVLYVRDNGIGIPAEHHERIFGLFNKLDGESEGTGVGLALVKRIIEIHQGRVWVESEAGEGSTFYFTLPAPPPKSES